MTSTSTPSPTAGMAGMAGSAGMAGAAAGAATACAVAEQPAYVSRIAPQDVGQHVRAITDAEEAFYHAHGWVKMPQLISAALAEELRRVGEDWHARQGKETTGWIPMAFQPGCELYRALVFHPTMGRNAQRLVGRARLSGKDVGVRYRIDHYVCKRAGSGGIGYHQDTTEHGTDRGGEMQFWFALAAATPAQGTMRFLSGVHREGPLAAVFGGGQPDLLQEFPRLTELYPMTDPMTYEPGDATVHHGFMVHGSAPNHSSQDRVSYILSYTPEDARWLEGTVRNWGSQRKPLTDEKNPVVFPGT